METLQDSRETQLFALEEFSIIRASPKSNFDEIAFLSAQTCNSRIAVISFSDGKDTWIQSSAGIEIDEVPFPGILLPQLAEPKVIGPIDFNNIKFFKKAPEFSEFPFIAGTPLITKEGYSLGILYVLDYQIKKLEPSQEAALKILGEQLMRLLEFRKQTNQLESVQHKLNQKNKDLEKFASVVSHDIKSPLANIISLTEFLKEENRDSYNEESKQYLDFLIQSSYSLRNYVDGILTFYRSDNILEKRREDVDLNLFFKNIAHLYQINSHIEISYPSSGILQNVNKAALTQIFLNLISNALKYNNKKTRRVDISFQEKEAHYEFAVKDNGNGISSKDFDRIFDLFTTLDSNDRDGNPGSGIGLATVKKMLDHMEGFIKVESGIDQGSNFIFTIKRK